MTNIQMIFLSARQAPTSCRLSLQETGDYTQMDRWFAESIGFTLYLTSPSAMSAAGQIWSNYSSTKRLLGQEMVAISMKTSHVWCMEENSTCNNSLSLQAGENNFMNPSKEKHLSTFWVKATRFIPSPHVLNCDVLVSPPKSKNAHAAC